MSEVRHDPAILPRTGIWEHIPELHQGFQDDSVTAFYSSYENGMNKTVKFEHTDSRPQGYTFSVVSPETSIEQPFNVYDLVVDEDEDIYRLYVVRCLGSVMSDEAKVKFGSTNDFGIEWHQFQITTGMLWPNKQDRSNFERIFTDLYKKLSTTKLV